MLIIDPDPQFRAGLEQELQAVEFVVGTAQTAEEAVIAFTAAVPDVVVLDLSLGAQALLLMRQLLVRSPHVIVVLVSGTPSLAAIVSALHQGAQRFLMKPIRAEQIVGELAAPKHELGMASLEAEGVDRFFAISPGLLAIQSFEGFFTMVNPAWERTLGYTATELCATPYLELVHPDDRLKATDEAHEICGGKAVFRFRNRYRCKDGSYRWLAWSATPSVEHKLIYAAARDVTAVVRMEEGLRASNELLKRSAVLREKHIAATSAEHQALVDLNATLVHDIKNPLSVIVANYDYILDAYDGSADCLAALQDSRDAGQRILKLLDNLVDRR